MNTPKEKSSIREKLFKEFTEYLLNAVYLSIFFSVIIFYRRQILMQYNIYLDDYFFGVIKALVIAKVIMIGAFLRISRKFENKPLIVPVLYKSFLFVIWVILFDLLEAYIRGLISTGSFSGAYHQLVGHHFNRTWFAGAVVVFFTFIPFFALKELQRVLGKREVFRLFFKSEKING
jgi:hypothetical protein